MRKNNWVAMLYTYIVEDYIKNKPEKAKDTIERILFLMQYDSLHEEKKPMHLYKKPMLPYKIYIYEDEIRVRYISDLLRVTRAMKNFAEGGGRSLPSWRGFSALLKYAELSKRYKNLTATQVERMVQRIIANETLDSKYFVFEKYEDKWMRKWARLNFHLTEQPILFFFWAVLTMLVLAPIVSIIPIAIIVANGDYTVDNAFVTRIIQAFIGSIIIGVPWLLWTRKWTKPTEYELEMLRKQKS